jgi:predicted ATPase with chaperone activity
MSVIDLIDRVRGSSVPKLETRLSAAILDRDAKQSVLDALLIDGQDGSSVMKAEAELTAASRRVLSLQSAIAAARAQQSAAQVEADEQVRRDHARKTLTLAEDRHRAIEKLTKAMATFVTDYNEVLKINSELLANLPMHDSMATLVDRYQLETCLRKELVRLGASWALSWPYGSVSIPALLPQFEGAMQVIRNLLSKDL